MDFEAFVRSMNELHKQYKEVQRAGKLHTQADELAVCHDFQRKHHVNDSTAISIARGYLSVQDALKLWDKANGTGVDNE
ncbi:MAG: hypothetical protein EGS42_13705 [Coprococcus eutactus]|jgi:hypothetical protein|nr:hypothetical protein [Coprococcus eutactus]